MQEYLVILLIILLLMSLVLVANRSFFKSRIHLRTRTVFATIGVTLLLGAFFPRVLSTFALSTALLIYLGAITLSAFALSYSDVKIPARDPTNPVITKQPENEIEEPALTTSTAFEFNEEVAFTEAGITLNSPEPAAAENNMMSSTLYRSETQYCGEGAAEEAIMAVAQPAHEPAETTAADLPDGITPDPVQECAATSDFTKTVAGETEYPPEKLLPETQLPSHMEESPAAIAGKELIPVLSEVTEKADKSIEENRVKKLLPQEDGQSIPADEPPGTMLEADQDLDETKSLNFACDVVSIPTDEGIPTTAGSSLVETQPDTKTVCGGDICTNNAVFGVALLQSAQDTSVEWPLPISENTPETVWREETREPSKTAYAAVGVAGEYGLIPGRDEKQFERCDLPVVELSPEINAAIPAEKTPASSHAPMDDFNNSITTIYTMMADGPLADAEAAYTSEFFGELAKGRTAGRTSKPAAKPGFSPETVNDNISAGFAAKASGDMASALVSFMNAFSLNQEPHTAVALAVEISNVYKELGHYPQAKLVIKSLLEQEYFNITPLRQQLEDHLLYLETFTELLKVAGMPPNAPYSKVPNFVKAKANIDTIERQRNNQGGI